MSNKIRRYFAWAAKLARKLENDSPYFFCGILVKHNTVLNFGFNHPYKTHPQSNNRFKTIHCELDAILGVPAKDLINSTLYLVRVGYFARSKFTIAKPCIHCQELLQRAQVKTVYFTISDDYTGCWQVGSVNYEVIQNKNPSAWYLVPMKGE